MQLTYWWLILRDFRTTNLKKDRCVMMTILVSIQGIVGYSLLALLVIFYLSAVCLIFPRAKFIYGQTHIRPKLYEFDLWANRGILTTCLLGGPLLVTEILTTSSLLRIGCITLGIALLVIILFIFIKALILGMAETAWVAPH